MLSRCCADHALIIYSVLSGKEKEIVLETEVQYGTFEISVMITGELQAIRETEIQAPSSLRSRNLRLRSVKIQDLIPEGTVVDSGDWVATLDRSEADNSLKDIMDNLEQEGVGIYAYQAGYHHAAKATEG